MRRLGAGFVTVLSVSALLGCQLSGDLTRADLSQLMPQPGSNPQIAQPASAERQVPAIRGSVRFPEVRKVQATTADLIKETAISLIDPVNNQTLNAVPSRADGSFDLVPPSAILQNKAYILEGAKGLNLSKPGSDAVRLRTLVWLNGQNWEGTSTPEIIIDPKTTAVAITSSLHPSDVSMTGTKDKVLVAGGLTAFQANPVFNNHPNSELIELAKAVQGTAAADKDPIAHISAIKPTLTAASAPSGAPGALIRLTGDGFYPFLGPTGTEVYFGTSLASVLVAEPRSLVVAVPATGGSITVKTPQGTTAALAFTLAVKSPLIITGMSASILQPAQSFTLFGEGFDPDKTKNKIYFGNLEGTVLEAAANSLVVKAPDGAETGYLQAKVTSVNPNPLSNKVFYELSPLRITEAPTTGFSLEEFSLKGKFPPQQGEVLFNDQVSAEILSWGEAEIKAIVPLRVPTGPIFVKQGTSKAASPQNYTPKDGQVSNWRRIINYDYNSYYNSWTTLNYIYTMSYSGSVYRMQFDASGNASNATDVGRLNIPGQIHPSHTSRRFGNFIYFVGDYFGDNRRVWIADVDANGVTGNFRQHSNLIFESGAGASAWGTNQIIKVKNRMYVFSVGRNDYGPSMNRGQWIALNADGSTNGGWNDAGVAVGNGLDGELLVVGKKVWRIAGYQRTNDTVFANIDDNANVGAFNNGGPSLPWGCEGAGATIVGKYVYVMTGCGQGARAEILDVNGSLGAWENISGPGLAFGDWHTDTMHHRKNFVYFLHRSGLYQADVQ
jgi:hypothetical protein